MFSSVVIIFLLVLGLALAGAMVGGLGRRSHAVFPRTPASSPVPSFRWHVVLILLPVVILAVAGVVALSRDQAAVEAEARQRARDLAENLAVRLSRTVPGELSLIELAGNVWSADSGMGLENGRGPDPTTVGPVLSAEEPLARVRIRYPQPLHDFLPLQIRFASDGSLGQPPPYPAVPEPPPWTQERGEDVRMQWEQIRHLEATSADTDPVQAAWTAFARQVSSPDLQAAARYRAQFVALRANAAREPASAGISALLALTTNAVLDRVETESGIPFGVVMFNEARRQAPNATLDSEWFAALKGLVLVQPSLFTPWLLDQARQMTHTAASDQALTELQARWESAQRRRALATGLQQRVPLTSTLLTNVWLTNAGTVWLAIVQPAQSQTLSSTGSVTHTVSSARWVSADLLGQVFWHATESGGSIDGREQRLPPALPPGLKLAFSLEGRAVDQVPASWAATPPETTPLLAEATGEFQQEALGPDGRFDNWPSRPRFTVRVWLADPAALFAAQRRQQGLFVGLIVATAGVAGFGVWQSQRAFRRQLALNEQKSNFVSSVSHELRTPLASLRLLAEGLASGRITETGKLREYAGFLVQETRRLGSLVENVLDFARIEQGRKRYEFEPTHVARLIRETVRLMEPLAVERQVRLESVLPSVEADETLTAIWDGRAIQQALVNLLDNALKHAPEGTVVTVTLQSVGTPITPFRLQVRDQGPGIPAEDQVRIFERFYRRGSELRRETQGIGLGLSLVQHIVASHGGTVAVDSEPGHGATFTLELPVRGN